MIFEVSGYTIKHMHTHTQRESKVDKMTFTTIRNGSCCHGDTHLQLFIGDLESVYIENRKIEQTGAMEHPATKTLFQGVVVYPEIIKIYHTPSYYCHTIAGCCGTPRKISQTIAGTLFYNKVHHCRVSLFRVLLL